VIVKSITVRAYPTNQFNRTTSEINAMLKPRL